MSEETNSPIGPRISRRKFIGSGAAIAGGMAAAGVLPLSLMRAISARANTTFDLSQIKHIVFMMQENRSYDHYFGAYPKGAGFSDPEAITLPNGNSVFRQPDPENPDGYVEPFHISTVTTGAAAIPSLSHDWRDQHASWNQGLNDRWIRTHTSSDGKGHGTYTMGYYVREDIPFHWALADSFTLLDHYHCSVMGPTHPNRYMHQTGTVDPAGTAAGPALDNNYSSYRWTTAGEVLLGAGYTFKMYQQSDNYGCNMFENFVQIQQAATNTALYQGSFSVSTLWGDGTPGGLGDPTAPTAASDPTMAFEEDCANGVLPDVSWIVCTSTASEHPSYLPAAGAQAIASKLEALAANDDLWNSTVFILNYDENDGFFDHVVPPTPDPSKYPEEYVHLPSPGGTPGGGLSVGAGFRVPCVIISPWTVGGNIFSGLSDHTSCLQFVESVAAAGGLSGKGPVTFSNISQWRRDTFSDLTSAFVGGTAAQPAPTNTEFEASTRAAELSTQTTESSQAQPAYPGATQNVPTQSQ